TVPSTTTSTASHRISLVIDCTPMPACGAIQQILSAREEDRNRAAEYAVSRLAHTPMRSSAKYPPCPARLAPPARMGVRAPGSWWLYATVLKHSVSHRH